MANSYSDDLKVKISEKYKPPCRISLPITYSQRLMLNKQLQESRPAYDFSFEESVLVGINEMKNARRIQIEDRQHRLTIARKEFEERLEKQKREQEEAKKQQEKSRIKENQLEESRIKENPTDSFGASSQNNYYKDSLNHSTMNTSSSMEQNYLTSCSAQNYVTTNGILMPIPVSNASYSDSLATNILTPMPLHNANIESATTKTNEKTFNISDFDPDTSSPFDNMELKSINDLEELAQVLKSDRSNYQPSVYPNTGATSGFNPTIKSYNQIPQDYLQSVVISQDSRSYTQIPSTYSQVNTSFNLGLTGYNQYSSSYTPQSNVPYYVPSAVSNYSNLNGYYYNSPAVSLGVQNTSYTNPNISNVSQPSIQKSSCKSVPDLVRSLEKELDNTRLNDSSSKANFSYTTTDVQVPTRPKSTDSVYPKAKIKHDVFNPYQRLSREQKDLCRNVSLMGFPLDRVARICLVVGTDQKKMVEHLLALSELLELGFSETNASTALLQNDNDRDKALEQLIS